MMKFFVYELKKNVWTLVVLTALATILYVVVQSASNVIWKSPSGQISVETPQIGVVYGELGVLCTLVPVLMYSFKMNKRSVDEFYSLPIKREKIYLAKTLAGLILVMVPYAVAYWSGFLSVALRENYYHLGYYAAGYFGGVLFGLFSLLRAGRRIHSSLPAVLMLLWSLFTEPAFKKHGAGIAAETERKNTEDAADASEKE